MKATVYTFKYKIFDWYAFQSPTRLSVDLWCSQHIYVEHAPKHTNVSGGLILTSVKLKTFQLH